jgi:hypothetical protein
MDITGHFLVTLPHAFPQTLNYVLNLNRTIREDVAAGGRNQLFIVRRRLIERYVVKDIYFCQP